MGVLEKLETFLAAPKRLRRELDDRVKRDAKVGNLLRRQVQKVGVQASQHRLTTIRAQGSTDMGREKPRAKEAKEAGKSGYVFRVRREPLDRLWSRAS